VNDAPSEDDSASVTNEADALKTCPSGTTLNCYPEGVGGKLLCSCEKDPPVTTQPPPQPVPLEVVAGAGQVCALVKDATGSDQSVRCWGNTSKLGRDPNTKLYSGVSHIACATDTQALCMILTDGRVRCVDPNGKVGIEPGTDPALVGATAIATNGQTACASVGPTGTLRCWDANSAGRSWTSPLQSPVTSIALDGRDICGVVSSMPWCFGNGDFTASPQRGFALGLVTTLVGFSSRAPGHLSFCEVGGGAGFCWGGPPSAPTAYSANLADVVQIAAGDADNVTVGNSVYWSARECALTKSGVSCWTDYPSRTTPTPVPVLAYSGFGSLAVGHNTVFAIYQQVNLYGAYINNGSQLATDDGQVPGDNPNGHIVFSN
jgi:hypothetical protein